MKRITSLLLAFIMAFTVILSCKPVSYAAGSGRVTSDAGVDFIKKFEGFSKYPVWDYGQYSVGYGTRCPDDKLEEYRANGISEEDALALLREHLAIAEDAVNSRIIGRYNLNLSQNQFDALVSFTYNCGAGWTYESGGVFFQAIVNGATNNELIRAFALWCSAGGQVLTALLNRRLAEANMYLNGIYSRTPPSHYCYVLYDANGGTTAPRTQGYSTQWAVSPFPVPTYPGHTFEGWYTAPVGGTKVTALDASHKGKTLYAHWDGNGGSDGGSTDSGSQQPKPEDKDEIVSGKPIDPVTVTVTGSDVNVRRGPGTNYAAIGTAQRGDQLKITEIGNSGGHTWGRFQNGWISLTFTNYHKLDEQTAKPTEPKPTEPKPTESKPTEPKPTQPKPTEPKPTEPKPTQPKPTEPKPTEPKPTQPKAPEPDEAATTLSALLEQGRKDAVVVKETWTGEIVGSRDPELRSEPGIGYSAVGNATVGSVLEFTEVRPGWAKTADGWISMRYVKLLSVPNVGDAIAADSWIGQVYDCKQLSVRSGPDMESEIVGCVNDGTVLTLSEIKEVESQIWGKTEAGWVSMKYVRVLSVPNTFREEASHYWTAQVMDRREAIVYSEPDVTSDSAEYLSVGSIVQILEMKMVNETAWAKLPQGWIALEKLELLTVPTEEPEVPTDLLSGVVNVNDYLKVYGQAGTEGDPVDILGANKLLLVYETATVEETLWGRIQQGWVCMDQVTQI